MLAKDELVRELILLLLRSLKQKHRNKFTALTCTTSEGIQTDKTYTSCRYLKVDSSFGTTPNWFPSKYL